MGHGGLVSTGLDPRYLLRELPECGSCYLAKMEAPYSAIRRAGQACQTPRLCSGIGTRDLGAVKKWTWDAGIHHISCQR
jgi:hypothetical protein